MTTDVLTEEAFARNVNTKFRITVDESRKVEIELVEVASYAPNPGDHEGMIRFSAFFESPASLLLQQGTFMLEHDDLGTFPLFMSPVARTDNGFRYEAVVNRMKDKDGGAAA